MLKQLRKEERKLDKRSMRTDDGEEQGFNPAELRAHR